MKFRILLACVAISMASSACSSAGRKPANTSPPKEEPKVKGVSRDKGQLTITLKSGKKKTYKDNLIEGTESYIRHEVVDYVEKNRTLVIQQFFYEGGQFLVVSLKDGSEIITPTKPTWSPEKNNFIAVNDDESDYTDNKVVIGSCKAMKCKTVFNEDTHSGNEKWIDDKTVEFEKRKFDPGTGKGEVKTFICKVAKKVSCAEKIQ